MHHRLSVIALIFTASAYGQQNGDTSVTLQRILDRLDQLEQQNRELVQEVTNLRQELAATRSPQPSETAVNTNQNTASLEDRVKVNEARIAEQAQTKVEAAHKSPVQLTGVVLFNAFSNSVGNNASAVREYNLLGDSYGSGATMRQTLLGFNFQGPQLPAGGHVNGSLMMDFWSGPSSPGSNWIRLREAYISLDWNNRSFTVGQEKPLISPYAPDSLAEVGIPPLSGAGNLWYWLPQARYEERIGLSSNSGIKAQVAVLQTGGSAYQPSGEHYVEPTKPALEGRFAFWHRFDETRRFEIAPGFHVTSLHVQGSSVDSRIASLDWLLVPASHLTITGTAFTGLNVAELGSLGNWIMFYPNGIPHAVHSSGGWTQLAVPITNRLTWNTFMGLENDNRSNLGASAIVHDWSYASNVMYHLNSNFVIGLEGLQLRTRSASGVSGVQNRYDLAFGYLF